MPRSSSSSSPRRSSSRSHQRGRSSSRRTRGRSSQGSSVSSGRSQVTQESGFASATSSKGGVKSSVEPSYAEVHLTLQHCRVIHFPQGSKKFQIVCCNHANTCPKSGHKKTPIDKRGAVGFYRLAKTKSGNVKGAILDSHETVEVREARIAATRASNRDLQAGIQGLSVPGFFDLPGTDRHKLPSVSNPPFVNIDNPLHLAAGPAPRDLDQSLTQSEGFSDGNELPPVREETAVAAPDDEEIALADVPLTTAAVPTGAPTGALTAASSMASSPSLAASTSVTAALPPVSAPPPMSATSTVVSLPTTSGSGVDPSIAALTGMIQQLMQNQNNMMQQMIQHQANGAIAPSMPPSVAPTATSASVPPTVPMPASTATASPSPSMVPLSAGSVPSPNVVPPVGQAPAPSPSPSAGPSILRTSNLYAKQNPVAPPKDVTQQAQDARNLQSLLGGGVSTSPMTTSANGIATVGAPAASMAPSGANMGPDVGGFAPVMDPSMGSKDKVYGLQISNAVELTKGLAPSALGTYEAAKRFCEGLNDVCAQPNIEGTSTTSEVENALTNSLRSITNNRDALSGGAVDTSYGNLSRNALRKVKSVEHLSKLLSAVNEEQENTLKTMLGDLSTTLQFYLPIDHDTAVVMVHNSILFRIGSRTLEIYLLFLSTMLTMGLTQGWEVCKVAVNYHADKLAKIRVRYGCRVQVLMANYTHFRENMSSKFCPPDFLSLRMDLLQKSFGNLGSGGYCTPICCSHCGTMIHGNGPCPWQQEKASNAQKAAAKALREGIRKNNGGGGGNRNRNNGGGNNNGNGGGGGNTNDGNGGAEGNGSG